MRLRCDHNCNRKLVLSECNFSKFSCLAEKMSKIKIQYYKSTITVRYFNFWSKEKYAEMKKCEENIMKVYLLKWAYF